VNHEKSPWPLGILGPLRHNSKLASRAKNADALRKPTNNLTGSSAFVRRRSVHDLIEYSSPTGAINFSSGQVMDKLYFGLGAAFYLLFVVWCIATPQK